MNEIMKLFCFLWMKIKRFFRFVRIKYIRFERSYLKNKDENTNRKFLLRSIAAFSILLIAVMLFPPVEYIFIYLTGASDKLNLIELIGWGVSGIIGIFAVIGLLKRAAALDEQNKISEKGHIDERFKTAAEHLGNERVSVRIAAFYEFYHIANKNKELRETIFDILHAHLRETTRSEIYQGKETNSGVSESKRIIPTEEVQSLLNILFRPKGELEIFYDTLIDLESANLYGANLMGANLQEALMNSSNLQEAFLHNTNLQETFLNNTNLQKAFLNNANMTGADLTDADLRGAHLTGTDLTRADLTDANLKGADLTRADLTKADLTGATMPDNWGKVVKRKPDGTPGDEYESEED